jgi:hypothetical protein
MTKDVRRHATTIAVSDVLPEIPAGGAVAVKLKLSCAEGCDLRGLPLTVTAPDGGMLAYELATCDAGINETDEIALKAPPRVGEHLWRIAFAPSESAAVVHEASELTLGLRVKPQESSLAVWAIPSPVVTGERFEITVGAKSAADFELTGKEVEVCDQAGTVMARARLGARPWPGTSALYWAPVELLAPATPGMLTWSARFAATELELPHAGALAEFSVVIVPPPEHRMTVTIVDKETAAPIADAQVRLGAYRAVTGPSGRAEVQLPKGVYQLNIWKVGYEAAAQTIDVHEDIAVDIEAVPVPEENPDAAWKM